MTQLCKICNKDGREAPWLPISLTNIESILLRKIPGNSPQDYYPIKNGKIERMTLPTPNSYEYGLRKNICYSLQYLEYLLCTDNQLHLTSVLTFQNYKTFIIVSAGIVEGILYHELKSNGINKKSDLNSLGKTSVQKTLYGKLHTFVTEIFEHSEKLHEEDMTFDQMISIVESKKLLGEDHQIYSDINALRKLRNKIHIHLAKTRHETDYNSFDYKKLYFAKDTLLDVLIKYFSLSKDEVENHFSFLSTNDESLTLEEAQDLGII